MDKIPTEADKLKPTDRVQEIIDQNAAKLPRRQNANAKKPLSIRIDQDVVERFKQDGEGWQARMNEILRKAVGV